ncbi:SGNH/GDSL hydrolase family protein [Granulicella tundricola]|uniref:Lipolytic protein G-D-S-L family n=1 Tax=Granulicella tundricola (strain ATCC BAA-1859 / DSM 23138 / MP5ACTX9) TaxID=1198114 RepID=E8X1K1_GRATM|nr:SGNH/GDSL hydrolase family protein [Granulicella tundricola]ADW70236.1 lipolytic protein G-D-S-L family [Granulicella tundricola MP5ACTX9]
MMIAGSIQRSLLVCVCAVLGLAGTASAAKPKLEDHWVGTWATSPYQMDNAAGTMGGADMTIREIVHVSLGGPLLRVELTNEHGVEPLTIGGAHVALTTGRGDVSLVTSNALTFGGKDGITIPAGATAMSDPFALTLPPLSDLAVTLFVPAQPMTKVTFHGSAFQTNYLAPGNLLSGRTISSADGVKTSTSWFFLKGVDVKTTGDTGAIVTLGDSITDGAQSTVDANATWPDELARRLQGDKKTKGLGVLNEGIGGNRLLHDNAGPSALRRFDMDVLSRPGVKYLVVLEGINDIGHAYDPVKAYDVVTADDIIQALAQLAERAHVMGIKVYGATLTPYGGAKYASPAGEAVRQAYNNWIRTTKALDGFIDFEKVVMDPASPATFPAFSPAFNKADHLHPNDAGYKAMGDAIDLKLFTGKN